MCPTCARSSRHPCYGAPKSEQPSSRQASGAPGQSMHCWLRTAVHASTHISGPTEEEASHERPWALPLASMRPAADESPCTSGLRVRGRGHAPLAIRRRSLRPHCLLHSQVLCTSAHRFSHLLPAGISPVSLRYDHVTRSSVSSTSQQGASSLSSDINR